MSPGVVFDLVLDELEARQADSVERLVVGAAGIGDRKRRRTPNRRRLVIRLIAKGH